ncbi:hypothetical protein [Tabrizicola sp.]|uniref:hypothetical protein n=1 Tax=Tabrizicola sp. TaxID=2005166 RepID=UPI003F36C087
MLVGWGERSVLGRMLLRLVKWAAISALAAVLLLILAMLFWPLPFSIAPVLDVEPRAVSAEVRLAFQAEGNTETRAVQLLMGREGGRGLQRHLLHVALSARLLAFTSAEQRAAFIASNSYYGRGHKDLAAFAADCMGKLPSELGLAEAAELVTRTRAPSRYADVESAARLLEARDRLLQELADRGLASQAEVDEAVTKPLGRCP